MCSRSMQYGRVSKIDKCDIESGQVGDFDAALLNNSLYVGCKRDTVALCMLTSFQEKG